MCNGEEKTMKPRAIPVTCLCVTLLAAMAGCGDTPERSSQSPNSQKSATENDDTAIAKLKELGAEVEVDEQGSVTSVSFFGADFTKVTDAELEHLKGFPNLESLELPLTQITDAGLEHLKGLTNLESLTLTDTGITDAGLIHLEGMTQLEKLDLRGTQVKGPGLVHLKGMKELFILDLAGSQLTDAGLVHLEHLDKTSIICLTFTHVTDEGAKRLQGALPNCEVAYETVTVRKPSPNH